MRLLGRVAQRAFILTNIKLHSYASRRLGMHCRAKQKFRHARSHAVKYAALDVAGETTSLGRRRG